MDAKRRFLLCFCLLTGPVVFWPRTVTALSVQELASGVYTLGSAEQFGSANVGWAVFDDCVLLIGAPHPQVVERALAEIRKQTPKPIRDAVVTHVGPGELESIPVLARQGIAIIAGRDAATMIRAVAPEKTGFREVVDRLVLGDDHHHAEILKPAHGPRLGDVAVYLPESRVLFAGEFCVNGPRAVLTEKNTERWLRGLRELAGLAPRVVVPGFGSPGGPVILERQMRYLRELRRQVGSLVAQARPLDAVVAGVQVAPEWLVCMPYDQPIRADIEHLYRELTVPSAPFLAFPFAPGDSRPKGLAIISDRVHDPGHIEAGLALAFEHAGIDARFIFDVRALTAENLKPVRVLVILRDGGSWPTGPDGPLSTWMTPGQEQAVKDFVESGGGLLALHNATALYAAGGVYSELVGGTYEGHGPLERFRVEVIDDSHPITRGVAAFEVADEQHTPVPNRGKVRVLLESRSDGGVVGAAGWAYRHGRGRVGYLANGHTREALFHPEFQKLLRNAMTWCAIGETQ